MRIAWFDPARRPSAGRVLAVASVVPALVLAGWLLAGLPLLLLGVFRPLAVVPPGLLVIALLCRYGLRRLPETVEATAWQVTGVLGVALASGVCNALLHSEQLIVRRDPATYAQYAVWLARHGSLPVPADPQAFGGPDPGLRFDSVGFYDHGGAVVPQFMPGPPMVHAVGAWLGDLAGMLLVPPLLGAAAVLVLAGVVARLAGARWAPLAALAFAVSLPIVYTSRTTFSEIPSMIMLFGGLALLHDARVRLRSGVTGVGYLPSAPSGEDPRRVRAAQPGDALAGAALAGLVFGLAVLVRIDGLRDVLPVLGYAGLLVAVRRAGGREEGRLGLPLLAGLVTGAGLGLLAGRLLAAPYLEYLSGSLVPLLAICGAFAALMLAVVALAPRLAAPLRRLGRTPRLPEAAAAAVALIMVVFAARPWLQTVVRRPVTPEDQTTAQFITVIQRANGLSPDGTRLYYEDSLYWVVWYVGVPAVVLATLAAAVLARRLVRGTGAGWLLPLAVVGWTTVTTLYRPAITPDQPWAARRLVPVVVPGLVLLAVWGLRWVRDKARRSGYGPAAQARVAAAGAVLLLVPPVITTAGTFLTPVERGERAAVEAMCAALPPRASVLIVERVTGDRFTQVVRGTCGVPTARVPALRGDVPPGSEVLRLADRVRAAGRVPVLLAAGAAQLSAYGMPVRVMALRTRQDERSLISPPDTTWSLSVDVWMAVPRPAGSG
ncbi:hypothetical protein FHS43_000932 [Streptosporangium becharense]|uniref:Glycosyltransferase RgtA/B/C/D-like domain-containing protein n=1 Tax=Streptosporangium becharense TaxID=1816182 RepID=A0A7W9MGG7_9ACTN|nr:hypothetical protein [Streptosporangium becharense]MBB2909686.1 hypothetical protein [Streptosporangium becharense]MBB5819358.1 hypothetical protein [Streptosporangium becharense]